MVDSHTREPERNKVALEAYSREFEKIRNSFLNFDETIKNLEANALHRFESMAVDITTEVSEMESFDANINMSNGSQLCSAHSPSKLTHLNTKEEARHTPECISLSTTSTV